MAGSMSAELKEKIEKILCGDLEPNLKIDSIRGELLANNLAEYRIIAPERVLCHPSNRGGMMLNKYDVHKEGSIMLKVGVKLDRLTDADAFEVSRKADKRAEQIRVNTQLAETSENYLAPVVGSEIVLSVGCSHTVAFCRAVLTNCKTSASELATASGHLNLDSILVGKDRLGHPFYKMCSQGWTWCVISSEVEEAFPQLPALWQSTLNSSHAVSGQALEMETALLIAEVYKHTKSMDAAVAATRDSQPRCLHYLDAIVHYVKNYAGGESFSVIHYLADFSKTLRSNLLLGEEYMKAVSFCTFAEADTLFPMLRAGLLAAQLTSAKEVDGVARMLTKSDVEKLKSKDFFCIVSEGLEITNRIVARKWFGTEAFIPLDYIC